MPAKLLYLAQEIVETLAQEYAEDASIDLDDRKEDVIVERVGETIATDAQAIAIIGEIDLDTRPDGDSLFEAIQKAADRVVRNHVESFMEIDPRFKASPKP